MASDHSGVDAALWSDPAFVALSRPRPNAQSLLLYLLTGPHTAQLPGLYRLGVGALSEELGWPIEDIRRIRDELANAGLAFHDDDARVIYVPNALNVCPPTPECLESWMRQLRAIPQSSARTSWCDDACKLAAQLEGFGETFQTACIAVINGIPDLYISLKSTQTRSKKKNISCPNGPNDRNDSTAGDDVPYAEIIAYLNDRAGKRYRHGGQSSRKLITARWREGFRLDAFQAVIDAKCAEWLGSDFEKYLRPETLFSPKFESYLNAKGARASGNGTSNYRDLDTNTPSQEDTDAPA